MNGFLESLHAFITAPIRDCSVGWFFVFYSVASVFGPVVGGVIGLVVWMELGGIITRREEKRLRKRERSIKARAKIRYGRKLAKATKRIRAELRLEMAGWPKHGKKEEKGAKDGELPPRPSKWTAPPPSSLSPSLFCHACSRGIIDPLRPRICPVLSTSQEQRRCEPDSSPRVPAPATFRRITQDDIDVAVTQLGHERRASAGEDNGAPPCEPR